MLRKLKTSEKAEALQREPLFAGCTQEEIEEILHLTTEAEVREGQVLCREGDVGHEFFVLVEGTAAITSAKGLSMEVGPGDFFGELALLDDGPRATTITMTSDGHVLVMTGPEFRTLLHDAPSIAVRMLPVLAARLRAAGTGTG